MSNEQAIERKFKIIKENINLMVMDWGNLDVGEMHRLKREVNMLYQLVCAPASKCDMCDCLYPCSNARRDAREAMR